MTERNVSLGSYYSEEEIRCVIRGLGGGKRALRWRPSDPVIEKYKMPIMTLKESRCICMSILQLVMELRQ